MGLRRKLIRWLVEHQLPKYGWVTSHKSELGYDRDGLRTRHTAAFLDGPAFQAAYARGNAMPGAVDKGIQWRIHVALWAARQARDLPGDFVECGVNAGVTSGAILADLDWNTLDKTFWLLDTFEGPDPALFNDAERAAGRDTHHLAWDYASVEEARAHFAEWPRADLVQGRVPDTLPRVTSERIAFVHLDMNCAAPELAAARALWPRLVPGALMLLDDYAYEGYDAQRRAFDGFASEVGISVLTIPTGQGLIVKSATPVTTPTAPRAGT